MDKSKFKVIKGGTGINITADNKKYISGFVTNTRLMGVLVIYVHWRVGGHVDTGKDGESLHQFFYIDTTEIGLESYMSVYGSNQRSLVETEQSLIGGLGGEKISLTEKEACLLIQEYAEMTENFGEKLPGGLEEYEFILEMEIEHTPSEDKALFKKTCVNITSAEQLINYFLIRYSSSDFVATDYLSYKPIDRDIIPNSKKQVLCVNKIESRFDENHNQSFICESLIEDQAQYRILITEIRLSGKLVSSMETISDFPISSAEAAMKLARPEFVTVFEIMDDRNSVIESLNEMYPAALKRNTETGKMYLMFKNSNDHLKESLYRLNDDIKGIVFVTDEDQLIVAGYTLPQIHKLENELQYSSFGNLVIALAKYEFKESILYDFMQSTTGDFLHYMEYVSDYDPDNE